MNINYPLIKKIHLYACLSTMAILLMFIVTSYQMIHHDWFDHTPQKETILANLTPGLALENTWPSLIAGQRIKGRLVRESTNKDSHPVREYATAGGSTRITLLQDAHQAEIIRTTKSTSDAIAGIHRIRGYGGPFKYNLYALLLDVAGISLIAFTVTGIIMWFKLLKNHRTAWIIFISGFLYFALTMAMLVYW